MAGAIGQREEGRDDRELAALDHMALMQPGYPRIGFHWGLYAQMDASRQWQGKLLDSMGLGPVETPSRAALATNALTLRAYGEPDASKPALLIVPAPIKRSYIWDMLPRASVVQRCLENQLQVYVVHWELPGEAGARFGLAEYAGSLILKCVDAIRAETGRERIFIAGHSLGGTFAAIFSALHADRLDGLALLASPLHFGPDVSAFGPMIAALMRAHLTDILPGNVPGSLLDIVSYLADPDSFGWSRWTDWLDSQPDPEALQTHLLVERWTLDEMPLARRLVKEVVECLYRDDRFVRGDLAVGDQRAAPECIGAPVLSVAETRSPIAPPESILPFYNAVPNEDKTLLWYEGDRGVSLQHVGMLVGKSAHRTLWPRIIGWMHAHVPLPPVHLPEPTIPHPPETPKRFQTQGLERMRGPNMPRLLEEPIQKISRPRQLYTGHARRPFVPVGSR